VAAVVDAAADVADQETDMKTIQKTLVAVIAGAFFALPATESWAQAAASPTATKSAAKQKSFASPKEAVTALIAAIRAKSTSDLLAVVGPSSGEWLFSGDKVADANDWARFLAAYDQKNALERSGDTVTLAVGNDGWPFPAPIVKKAGKWTFDAAAGREEVINRRIGRNELDTMQAILAVVDAQREYAAKDADGNGFADYAKRFMSSPGKKDGLYWPSEGNAPQSPLGPLVAVASREGYGKKGPPKEGQLVPYHGYYYRIITAQGKDAPGGAYDYMVAGKLLGGFAVVAWPASYRNSGVMTFIVNHDGVVHEKDLGAQTASIAAGMTRYNPDATWKKAQ